MQQSHDPILRRLGKLLHDQDEDITHEPVPKRWVDLIHFLDEQERKRDEVGNVRLSRAID
jgi:hypothetical protein